MSKQKLKILLVNEFSALNTGYSVFGRELLSRLYATNKYQVAEFASYGEHNDPRMLSFPWRIYPNMPGNEQEKQIYESDVRNQFGKWRFEDVLLDYKPHAVCIPPGNIVMTENGYKNIEDIQVGDMVLTHLGRFKPVTHIYKRQHIGRIRSIRINGCRGRTSLTKEHPLFSFKQIKQTNQKKSYHTIYHQLDPGFIQIRRLKEKDIIAVPCIQLPVKDTYIPLDISQYITNFIEYDGFITSSINSNCNKVKKIIQLTPDFFRLVGYILADGSISSGGVNITLMGDEFEYVEDIINIVQNIFAVKSYYKKAKDRFMYTVYINSVILRNFFKKFLQNKKHLPKEIWQSNVQCAKELISGLVRSDGHYAKNTVSFSNANKYLVYEYYILCLACKIPVNISFIYKKQYKTKYYHVNGYGESAVQLHNIVKKWDTICTPNSKFIRRNRNTQILNDKYFIASIKNIKNRPYNGQVYNLEVQDDNSYIVNNICVHNCGFRDVWMESFIEESPFKQLFHWNINPTYDSGPHSEEWLSTYMGADSVFAYSEFGKNGLESDSNGRIKVRDVAPPCVDLNIFKPILDKKALRQQHGIDENCYIVGTTMRNQRRKLFPELFNAFAKLIQQHPSIGQKTYLYCHTSIIDQGWDIPKLLKESGIANKVYFTYICKNCRNVFASFYRDSRAFCPRCHQYAAITPNVKDGLNTHQLAEIYNLFDIYVQYSVAEGLGIPMIEGGACSVPIMAVDYSGMSNVVRQLGGIPIDVQLMYREAETGFYRSYPNNDDFITKLVDFLKKPNFIKQKLGRDAYIGTHKYYNWDLTTQKYMDLFDEVGPQLIKEDRWNTSSPDIFEPQTSIPCQMDNESLVRWAILHVLGHPQKLNTYFQHRLVRDLNYEFTIKNFGGFGLHEDSLPGTIHKFAPFHQNDVLNLLYSMRLNINKWEQYRINPRQYSRPMFLNYVKKDEQEYE